MLAEIVKLESDIDFLRQQVHADLVKPDAAATRIAHLSKELRGHVVEVDKITKGTDRRGLILAGADKVMKKHLHMTHTAGLTQLRTRLRLLLFSVR